MFPLRKMQHIKVPWSSVAQFFSRVSICKPCRSDQGNNWAELSPASHPCADTKSQLLPWAETSFSPRALLTVKLKFQSINTSLAHHYLFLEKNKTNTNNNKTQTNKHKNTTKIFAFCLVTESNGKTFQMWNVEAPTKPAECTLALADKQYLLYLLLLLCWQGKGQAGKTPLDFKSQIDSTTSVHKSMNTFYLKY